MTNKVKGLEKKYSNSLKNFINEDSGEYIFPIIIEDPEFGTKFLYDMDNSKKESSPEIVLGFLDSGILIDHPIFKNQIINYKDFTDEGINDLNGHGTQVAYIHYSSYSKIFDLKNIKFIIAKVLNKNLEGSEESIIKAIEWMMNQNAAVVHMSLGVDRTFLGINLCKGTCKLCLKTKELANKKIVTVASGNNGRTTCPARSAIYDSKSNVKSYGALNFETGKPEKWSGNASFYTKSEHRIKSFDDNDRKNNKSLIYNDLAHEKYKKNELNESYLFCTKAIEFAIEEKKRESFILKLIKNRQLISLDIVDKNIREGNYLQSISICIKNIQEIIKYKDKDDFKNILFRNYFCMGVAQYHINEFGNSSVNLMLANFIVEELGINDIRIGHLNSYIGLIKMINKDYEGALHNFEISSNKFKKFTGKESYDYIKNLLQKTKVQLKLSKKKNAKNNLDVAENLLKKNNYDDLYKELINIKQSINYG